MNHVRRLPYLEQMATFSTAHMSRQDALLLDHDTPGSPVVFKYPEGYFVRLSDEDFDLSIGPAEDTPTGPLAESMAEAGHHPAFVALLHACAVNGIRWVRFDGAWDEVEGFPVFPW